jgi:hypothetical protein
MTEEEWLTSVQLVTMLASLTVISDRKERLFARACCQRVWNLLPDDRSRAGVEIAERYADGLISQDELFDAWERDFMRGLGGGEGRRLAFQAVAALLNPHPLSGSDRVSRAVRCLLASRGLHGRPPGREALHQFLEIELPELTAQTHLCRHIFGNPFRPHPPLSHVSATVRQLAEILYQQDTSAIGPLT